MCLLIGYLQIGSFQGRLGDIHGDDGPITYSNFFVNPERYDNDILSTYGSQQVYATIQNWLPAFLYRYLSISPEVLTFILVFAQFLMLGLSVRRFSRVITGKEIIGWLTTLFIFGASPWDWNLANYGNVMYIPYAGHLVMPFILYAFCDVLEEKNLRAMLWLFFGGLIHPTLVLYAIGMIGIYWIIDMRFKKFTIPWILLILVALSTVLPRLIISAQFSSGDLLTFAEMKSAILSNQHMKPMNLNPRAKSFLWFIPIIFLALRERSQFIQKYSKLLLAVCIGCAILIATAWIGWKFEILQIIQFIPQRASTLFVFISLPLVLTYFYQNLKNGPLLIKISSYTFLFLFLWFYDSPYTFISRNGSIFWIIALLLPDILQGTFGPFSWRNELHIQNEKNETAHQKINSFNIYFSSVLVLLTCATFLALTLKTSNEIGSLAKGTKALAGYDMQVWVRDNTPENAMIIDISRAVSQRAVVQTKPYNWYVYNRSRACKDYVDRYATFYAPYIEKDDFKIGEDVLDTEGVTNFAAEFKADYVLRPLVAPLDLEEVYRNESYILYKIPIG